MDYYEEFERMMAVQTEIALATASGGNPNVRIVNFYYEPEKKTLYFSSFTDNQKVQELEQCLHVALTTIPSNGEEHVRIQHGIARKSAVPMEQIKDKFLAKLPDYLMRIPDILPALVLFEITFERADVVLDYEHIETITI